MSVFYKGAGPGTHWWRNNAQLSGFTVAATAQSVHAIIRHITSYSHPSPYLSFTASYDVACDYALNGPGGAATPANPGYVYEIDVTLAPGQNLRLIDPAREIISSGPQVGTVPRIPTHHDGSQNLILGIASRSAYPGLLNMSPRRPGTPAPRPPVIDRELEAVVFSLRDAEVIIAGNVPAACITARYPVS